MSRCFLGQWWATGFSVRRLAERGIRSTPETVSQDLSSGTSTVSGDCPRTPLLGTPLSALLHTWKLSAPPLRIQGLALAPRRSGVLSLCRPFLRCKVQSMPGRSLCAEQSSLSVGGAAPSSEPSTTKLPGTRPSPGLPSSPWAVSQPTKQDRRGSPWRRVTSAAVTLTGVLRSHIVSMP